MAKSRLAPALASAIAITTVSPAGADQPATAIVAATPTAGAVSTDPLFAQPYVDIDEWRDAPVRHRYVHGGFKNTETRFSFYFPPKDQYGGRFFQHVTPAPDSENLAQRVPPGEGNKIGFAIASGAYFVETNGGGRSNNSGPGMRADPTISAWRANAASAQYSRIIALQMYGGKRPYGYIYGGSGGAYRTVGAFENTHGIWDGAVPYVLGSSNASPTNFTVRMQAMRVLQSKLPQIVDAVEPGGSGQPFAGLTEREATALREATLAGFPIESWFGWKTMGIHAFSALYGGVLATDPGYFQDFWTKPGYLGFDHPDYFSGVRMQHAAAILGTITAADAAAKGLNTRIVNGTADGGVDNSFAVLQGEGGKRVVAFRLDKQPPDLPFLGGDLFVESGAAKGARLTVSRIDGDIVVLGIVDPSVAAKLAPGDAVRVDNSNFLAVESYHRHQVPTPDFIGWNQFRGRDGKPLYPQRPMLLGPLFTRGAAGSIPQGKWQGKMILVESLWDREAFPWNADWYRKLVAANLGPQTDANYRVWYTDHALHGDNVTQEDATHTVGYLGVLQQALRDLVRWVEKGTPPPSSTSYAIKDVRVEVPPTAAERKGIQPVVQLIVEGRGSALVKVGQGVRFIGTIAVPPQAGSIVAAQWDFDGSGRFALASAVPAKSKNARVIWTYRFDKPGIYFPVLRAVSQREGDTRTPYARIANLGRVRVVVE